MTSAGVRRAHRRPVDAILAALEAKGLLFVQDQKLPSVVGILVGEPLRTSWWSHPKGRLIFAVLGRLADHPDVLFTKLLGGKGTLVHRRLWPDLLAVGSSGETWQTRGLSPAARRLRARLDRSEGSIRASGAAVKELETHILAVTHEVHTELGRHETVMETWPAWSTRARCKPRGSPGAARKALERVASAFGAPIQALPWSK